MVFLLFGNVVFLEDLIFFIWWSFFLCSGIGVLVLGLGILIILVWVVDDWDVLVLYMLWLVGGFCEWNFFRVFRYFFILWKDFNFVVE